MLCRSWTSIANALADPAVTAQSSNLRDFLLHEHSYQALSHCTRATKPPNGQAKADFETRTAAINVTQQESGSYDIGQIKEDALWLAKLCKLDELGALRTAVLQWQDRFKSRVLGAKTDQGVSYLTNAVNSNAANGVNNRGNGNNIPTSQPQQGEHIRRAQLLKLWRQEQEGMLTVRALLARSSFKQKDAKLGNTKQQDPKATGDWLLDLNLRLCQTADPRQEHEDVRHAVLMQILGTLRSRMQTLKEDPGAPNAQPGPELHAHTASSVGTEVLGILRLAYILIEASGLQPSPAMVAEWFQTLAALGFLEHPLLSQAVSDAVFAGIQSLVALVLFTLLDIDKTVTNLDIDVNSEDSQLAPSYALDPRCVETISTSLASAVDEGHAAAAMALVAWSAIGALLQANGGDTGFDGVDRRDSHPLSPTLVRSTPITRVYGQAWRAYINDLQSGEATVEHFIRAAIQGFELYGHFSDISLGTDTTLGAWLIDSALDTSVRSTCLVCLREVSKIAAYNASLIEAVILVLRGRHDVADPARGNDTIVRANLVRMFLATPALFRLFEEAIARYPYEMRPLLMLCEALLVPGFSNKTIVNRLHRIPSFTERVPDMFSGYEATREHEFDNCFILREALPLFPSSAARQGLIGYGNGGSGVFTSQNPAVDFTIMQGTEGLAFSKDHPPVVSWTFEHSLATYLGKWLLEAHNHELWQSLDTEEIYATSWDCLNLLTKLIDTIAELSDPDATQQILAEISDGLPLHSDVVTIVTTIFENSLADPLRDDDVYRVLLMSGCVRFLTAVARSLPGRVWPFLSQPGLLHNDNTDGRLLEIIASSGRVANTPILLSAVLELFDTLLHDVVYNALERNNPKSAESHRFSTESSVDPGVPSKQMAKTTAALSRVALGVVCNVGDWRFHSLQQWSLVTTYAIEILDRLLRYTSVNEEVGPAPTLLAPLQLAAALLTRSLLGSGSTANLSRLISLVEPDVLSGSSSASTSYVSATAKLARCSAQLLALLLQLQSSTSLPVESTLESLIEAVPMFVRVYAANSSLQVYIAMLLAQIAACIDRSHHQSLSLFASFEPHLVHDAVVVLSSLVDVKDDSELARARWNLFSACTRNKQTWFASYLFTGSIPSRTSLAHGSTQTSIPAHQSVLGVALDELSSMSQVEDPAAVAMLQFVTDALNYWPWSIDRIQNHRHFLGHMAEQLDSIQWEPSGHSDVRTLARRATGASLVCEIFAMCFHGMRFMGNAAFVKEWSTRISLLDQPGFKDPYYNKGLHRRFKHNLEAHFPGARIDGLVRRIPDVQGDEEAHYDLKCIADVLHRHERRAKSGRLGFVAEFGLVDDNLRLVAAQKQLIIKWQLLCLELVKDATEDQKLPKKLAYVAHECLEANKAAEEQDRVFFDLRSLRVELSTTIMQKLVDIRYTSSGMHTLLSAAWDVTRAGRPHFDDAFNGDEQEYYRKCVRLLLLCLRGYTIHDLLTPDLNGEDTQRSQKAPQQKVNTMLEVATDVVARGFRSLASQLHAEPEGVVPADFVLLTSILQALLQVRGAEQTLLYSQLAARLTEFHLGRYAIALFSWSECIKVSQLDPIYGEISINLLAEMSVLPSLAESLATEGVLSQLNTTSLMAYFQRRGGVGPFEEPVRLHKIWTRGVLPLLLNVLIAVGAPFAAEAATFLNNFAAQLEVASTALDSKGAPSQRNPTAGCITYNTACEAHTLGLIAALLDRYRESDDADIPELLWDRSAVKDDVETWVQGTRAFLRERIVPTNEKETVLSRTKPVGGNKDLCEVQSRFEEVVLRELKGALFVLNGG